MTRKQYGQRIRQTRKRKSLSGREVARRAEISHVYLAEIEAGSLPSQAIAEALALALGDAACCGAWFEVAISEAKSNTAELRAAREKWEQRAEN